MTEATTTRMRAAVARHGHLAVGDVDVPSPGPGEALARVRSCGICGSDLHALQHFDQIIEIGDVLGLNSGYRAEDDVVVGHEFCVEVVELGPGNDDVPVRAGDLVVSMPVLFGPAGVELAGFTPRVPGAYAEFTVITTAVTTVVPNGLDARRAAVTEPLAVGLHAVHRSGIGPRDGALVIGCGPIGLVIVMWLKALGFGPIVATDFSPARRELAAHVGADVVVDPRETRGIDAYDRVAAGRPLVLFECVGVPGILDTAKREIPAQSRVLVAGVCMETDQILPFLGVVKELDIRFAYMYSPAEFTESLHAIAEGRIDIDPLITGRVGIDGIPDAFRALAHPDEHVKIVIEPDGPAEIAPVIR